MFNVFTFHVYILSIQSHKTAYTYGKEKKKVRNDD